MQPATTATASTNCTSRAFRSLNQLVEPAVRAGLGSPWPIGGGLVVLETIGRVSGKPRRVPLVANRIGNTVWVSTVRPSSQWVANLEADPEVKVWVGGTERQATAEVVTAEPMTVVSLALR